MEGKAFLVMGMGEEREKKLNFKKLKCKATFPVVGRERERGAFQGWGELLVGGLFAVVGGGGSFIVRRRGWGDGICVGCCWGWEGFLAHGGWGGVGFPTPGVLWRDDALGDKAAKGHSKWQWGYQSHREGGRKMNYWVRRESTGSFGSPVEPPVQTVQFRFPIASRSNWSDRTGTMTSWWSNQSVRSGF